MYMENNEKYYDVHGLVGISIEDGPLSLPKGYDTQLEEFKVDEKPSSIEYCIKEFKSFTLPEKLFKGSGDYFGFGNGIYIPKEKYAIEIKNGKITEYTTYAHRATTVIIQYLFLKHDVSLLHSAGAIINDKGIIFPAFGGAGKTSLIASLRKEKNFKFLGDDYIILDKDSYVYPYPTNFSIYEYHLSVFPELEGTSYASYLRRRRIFSIVYFIKRAVNFIAKKAFSLEKHVFSGHMADYIKVPVKEIISDSEITKNKNKLVGAIFLSRYNGEEICVFERKPGYLSKKSLDVLNLEFGQSRRYFEMLSSFDVIDYYRDFEEKQKNVLSTAFETLKCYEVFIPTRVKQGEFIDSVRKIIKEICDR